MNTLTKVTCGMGLSSLLAAPGAALASTTVIDSFHNPLTQQQLAYDGYHTSHGEVPCHQYCNRWEHCWKRCTHLYY